jgi:outer membrane protein OmpA-like peptidoglycan-associated protein
MFVRLSAVSIASALMLSGAGALAQDQPPNPTQQRPIRDEHVPVFHVTVVGRTTPAVNYRHRGGSTTIDFRGTPLLPKARGEAKVESKQGYTEIEVEFDDLTPAAKFGPEYLTYVMWAITPEGRATNLGEVILNEDRSKLNVTTEMQAFGLIVTAEPYFAVSQPSDVVVMENVIRPDTRGVVEQVEAKYELLTRGTYLMNSDARTIASRQGDRRAPLDLREARNAIELAQIAGADRYARETFDKASALLADAEYAREHDKGRRAIAMPARQATQTAEDARLIALRRQDDERIARAEEASADRERIAREQAQAEARRREAAEADRVAAERQRLDAERQRAEAERAAERAANERAEAQRALTAAEQAKAEAEQARISAERAQQQLAEQRAAAEAARAESENNAAAARQAAERAELEKAELRDRLQRQLNVILETRETARGLIVNVSDVLFDTGQHTLKPGAREKLARVAGIIATHPDLTLEVDGHTDNVGNDAYNQSLSERRAQSVRAYLIQQGIPPSSITAIGYGESQPVASNDVAAGRQQNRRVELVVSGESIGHPTPGLSGMRR